LDLDIESYFTKSIFVEGDKKEEDFLECVKVMTLEPSEAAVVGDRVENEIYIGNKLGMLTVWYRKGKFADVNPKSNLQEPIHTVYKMLDILNLMKVEAERNQKKGGIK